MKEIIYLDTNLMNSILAQMKEPPIINFSLEESAQESESEGIQTTRGKKAGLSGQIKIGTGMLPGGTASIGATLGNEGNESTNTARTILEGQKDILNKVFHDYALDILLDSLADRLKDEDNLNEGDFCLIESPFKFYDFELLQNLINVERITKILLIDYDEKEVKEAKRILGKNSRNANERAKLPWATELVTNYEQSQASVKQYEQISLVSDYFANSLRNLNLMKARNKISLVKKEFLRESAESLSLRTDKSRNAKFLVRVIGVKKKVFNGNFTKPFDLQDFDSIPHMIFDVLLGTFGIFEKDDLLVTPIAIFYE